MKKTDAETTDTIGWLAAINDKQQAAAAAAAAAATATATTTAAAD